MIKRILQSLVGMSTMLLALATGVRAQTTGDEIIHACYIPLVGVIYRIKAPGLPTACLAKSHIEFQWNAQGPKGDRGDQGIPGNLALAGQSCPTNFFVTGFNASGGLICRDANGNEPGGNPPPPPPPPPSPINGIWSLSPVLTVSCSSFLGPAQLSITQLRTTVIAGNQLLIEPIALAQLNGLTNQLILGGATVPVRDPLTFPIQVNAFGDTPLTGTVSGQFSYNISGSFSSLTDLSGTVTLTPGALTFGGSPLTCTPASGTITGTKLS